MATLTAHTLIFSLFLAALASGAAWYRRRRKAVSKMPPFIPFSELSLSELLAYPIAGHLPLFNDTKRLNRLAANQGGIVSFWLFNQPSCWCIEADFIREVFGLPGAVKPENNALASNHMGTAVTKLFGGIYEAPYPSELWQRQRKYLHQQVLSGAIARAATHILDEEVQHCLKLITAKALMDNNTTALLDPRLLVKLVPLNYLLQVAFGARFEGEPREELFHKQPLSSTDFSAENFIRIVEDIMRVFFTPSPGAVFPLLFPLDPLCREAAALNKVFRAYMFNQVQRARHGELREAPLLQDIVRALDAKELSMDDACEVLLIMFAAGIDTLSNTAIYFLQQMADHVDVQRKVQGEVDRVVGEHGPVQTKDLDALPYFWCALKESARHRPLSVSSVGRVPSADFVFRGFVLPAGSYICAPFISSMTEADKFDPDRHAANWKLDVNGRDVAYPMFGGGYRLCAGAKLAQQELGLILTNVLKSFTVLPAREGVPACGPSRVEGVLSPPQHVPLKFVVRQSGSL